MPYLFSKISYIWYEKQIEKNEMDDRGTGHNSQIFLSKIQYKNEKNVLASIRLLACSPPWNAVLFTMNTY